MVSSGYDITFVLDLDMLAFESLHAGCTRLEALNRIEQYTTMSTAMNGTKEGRKAFHKRLQEATQLDLCPEGSNDSAAFLHKFGGGI